MVKPAGYRARYVRHNILYVNGPIKSPSFLLRRHRRRRFHTCDQFSYSFGLCCAKGIWQWLVRPHRTWRQLWSTSLELMYVIPRVHYIRKTRPLGGYQEKRTRLRVELPQSYLVHKGLTVIVSTGDRYKHRFAYGDRKNCVSISDYCSHTTHAKVIEA